jgi:hypothetical protein
MRSRAALWRVVVVVVWLGAMAGSIALEYPLALAVAVPATLLAGALLGSWWATGVPLAAFAVVFAIAVAQDPSCSECGEDPWNLQLVYGMVVVVPATALMAIGVGARQAARAARRRSRPL